LSSKVPPEKRARKAGGASWLDVHLAHLAEVKKGLTTYFTFYNEKRWHQNFDRKTPAMVYFNTLPQKQAAA
jgi:hypothetical protein